MGNEEIEGLLDELLDATAAARDSRLRQLRASDPAAAERLERLLELALAAADSRDSLEALAPDLLSALAAEQPGDDPRDHIDERIGPYRIADLISSGGMGVVYRAERDDGTYQQQVAIKFVRRHIESEASHAMFVAERKQLAKLEHPNIARIIDAGVTTAGAPYYIMEYIDGQSIDVDCEQRSLMQRLALFLQLCDAIGYCHQSLVVHGDIKPANILVADGRLRLLDFGIGRVVDGSESTAGAQTMHAYSPLYAAPEQASGAAPTVTSDIYSMGVVLGQILSGREAKAIVPGPILEAALVEAGLPTELESILKRCLAEQPSSRYDTVSLLRQDIEAFQKHLPVSAHHQSRTYLTAKFVRRNRVLVASTLLVIGALSAGLGIATWQYNVAREEALRAQEVSRFVTDLFADVSPWVSPDESDITMREVMDHAVQLFPDRLTHSPDVRHEVMQIISYGYSAIHDYDKAYELQQAALDYWRQTRTPPDFNLATAQTAIARAHLVRGEYETAASLARDSLVQLEQLGRQNSEDALTAWNRLSTATRRIDPEASAAAARAYHEIVLATRADDPIALAKSYSILSDGATSMGDYPEAIRLVNKALTIAGNDVDRLLPEVVAMHCGLGTLLAFNGQWDEAYPIQRKCVELRVQRFGADSPELVSTRSNMAVISMMNGRIDEAAKQIAQAKALALETMPVANVYRLSAESNAALLAFETGRAAQAEPVLRSVMQRHIASVGEDHPSVGRIRMILGRVLLELGDSATAAELIQMPPAGVPVFWREDARLWSAELSLAMDDPVRAADLAEAAVAARRDSGQFPDWKIAEAEFVWALATGDDELRDHAAGRLRAVLPPEHFRYPALNN